jgi:NADPH:quinone reductase-like Zn-dependent oxidoreductase
MEDMPSTSRLPSRNLFTLPDNGDFQEGSVIAGAVVTAVHAIGRRAQVKASDTVPVIGAGGIGQALIQVAKHAGAKVVVVARRQARFDIALRMTADRTKTQLNGMFQKQ